jgi:predicted nuclease with TOPRIM domain
MSLTTELINKASNGWCPGYYNCKCIECSTEFQGSKRSYQCFECANIPINKDNIMNKFDGMKMFEAETEDRLKAKNSELEILQDKVNNLLAKLAKKDEEILSLKSNIEDLNTELQTTQEELDYANSLTPAFQKDTL